MRGMVLIAGVVISTLMAPGAAAAAAPTKTTESFGFTHQPYGATRCGGEQVFASLLGERTMIDFRDDDGTLVRQIRHVHYAGTLALGSTGQPVPYHGHFTIVADFENGTRTINGLLARVNVAGDGIVWQNAGVAVFVLTGPLVLEHGPHDQVEADNADLCAALGSVA